MRKMTNSKLLLIVVVGLVGMFSLSLRKTRLKTEYSAKILEQKEQSVRSLEAEVAKLKDMTEQLSSERYQEKIIRDELLMQKPGEIVVQLPADWNRPTPTQVPTPTPKNIQRWQEVLLH